MYPRYITRTVVLGKRRRRGRRRYVQEAEEEKEEQVRDGVKEEKVERPYFKKIETKSKFK